MLAASLVGDVARTVFGVALLAAGVAKVARGGSWSGQAAANHIPNAVARGLPWLELLSGAMIVSGVAPPWPAVVGVALVGAFTVWVVAQLSAGRHPPCACFGALSAEPLSWWHGARNAVLIALGIVAIVG